MRQLVLAIGLQNAKIDLMMTEIDAMKTKISELELLNEETSQKIEDMAVFLEQKEALAVRFEGVSKTVAVRTSKSSKNGEEGK